MILENLLKELKQETAKAREIRVKSSDDYLFEFAKEMKQLAERGHGFLVKENLPVRDSIPLMEAATMLAKGGFATTLTTENDSINLKISWE
jgi:hypothetical protein